MNWEAPTCVICLQDLSSNLCVIGCGHIFHTDCIIRCMANKNKTCPLCRDKIVPSKLMQLQYNLTLLLESHEKLGMSEEESKDITLLHSKITDLKNEIQANQQKIATIERISQTKDTQIQNLTSALSIEKENYKGLQEKYIRCRDQNNELDYELNKFKGLFTSTHNKTRELEEKVAKLVSVERLFNDIELNQSSVTWANNVRQSYPIEDQASEFFTAFMILSSNLKNCEKTLKEIKTEHSYCNDEINKLKRVNINLRKENDRIILEKSNEIPEKVIYMQRSFEQAFPLIMVNDTVKSKKTLTLINKN